uniref:SRPBCC family protein n=1 Tax=Candidatus Desulfatibia profunda TaxID=2841695 RepID=A0A8J6NNN2_9BACT|nr:SRPBCC family protein [Candidatus Desulfatibia profunda]
MTKFEASVVIKQPVARVFAFAANFDNHSKWQTDILESRQTSQGPFGPSSTYRRVNKFLGQSIETDWFITEHEPDRRCSYKITSGTVTGETSLIFEPVDCGTKLTTTGAIDLGFFRMVKAFVVRKVKQQLQNDLNRLKNILENGS